MTTRPVAGTRPIAAFDFDGTLTRRDTLLPFLASVTGNVAALCALARVAPRLAAGERDLAKERLLHHLLAGRDHDVVGRAGRAYGARLARTAIAPELRSRLAWHRREGHRVIIVSASLDVYLAETARVLAVDHLVCTRLEIDDHGRYTGHLVGANCRGAEKAKQLRAQIRGGERVVWAYGDSRGDDEMLALADHPVRVHRGRLTGRDRFRSA